MLKIGDLFQWDRFVTPYIIKTFYWLAVIASVLAGLSGLLSALRLLAASPIAAAFGAIASLLGMLAAIVFTRIAAEFFLMIFRINEHLAALRNRGEL